MVNDNKPLIGISIGDINGIGFEVIIKTFLDNRILNYCTPIVYASAQIANYHRKALNIDDFSFNVINDPANAHHKRFNLINCWDQEPKVELGQASEGAGEFALIALNKVAVDLQEGKIDAMVTAPINKKTIQSEEFNFPGHTEFLRQFFKVPEVLMTMISEDLRIAVATGHIPLRDVADALTMDLLVQKLELFNDSLIKDFSIPKPKIAVLGLNPHAGEDGMLGQEELNVISPAIEAVSENNILAFGPFPADGFFGTRHYRQFDGVMAMYHDQGLGPFKTLAFDTGVNYTAGMPVVRTSPDHGTGYTIAGKNEANESSFREALFLAVDILRQRKSHAELTVNPLKSRMIKEKESD